MSVSPPPELVNRPLPPALLQDAAATFGMLSATVRLQIVWLLASEERDVGTLAEETDQTVQAVSHHLAKLKLAGLVQARREGRRQVYYVDSPIVVEIVHLLVGERHEFLRPARRARHA
nr:Transcriptional regulator, ArsR family [Kibdelosporangium sp. MJ126-NF4]